MIEQIAIQRQKLIIHGTITSRPITPKEDTLGLPTAYSMFTNVAHVFGMFYRWNVCLRTTHIKLHNMFHRTKNQVRRRAFHLKTWPTFENRLYRLQDLLYELYCIKYWFSCCFSVIYYRALGDKFGPIFPTHTRFPEKIRVVIAIRTKISDHPLYFGNDTRKR